MARKKKKSNMYFTLDTQDAVVRYNERLSRCCNSHPADWYNTKSEILIKMGYTEDQINSKVKEIKSVNIDDVCNVCLKEAEYDHVRTHSERNVIYRNEIAAAFEKLAENIIHTFKFYYFDIPVEDVMAEVVSFLIMNIHKYKPHKGKAFSYFSIVVKNYLILHNNRNYAKKKIHDSIEVIDFVRNVTTEQKQVHLKEDKAEFINYLIEYWENNLTVVFKRKKDIGVADSVIYLLKTCDEIENFNKKYLYVLIRELTGSKTQHITRIINIMKKHNEKLLKQFNNTGYVDTATTGSFL